MKQLLYRILQCTWGLPQTLLGLLEFIKHWNELHYMYRGAVVTECKKNLNISLGMFVFITENKEGNNRERGQRILDHEYGHTLQSLLLGPLYLVIVGLPSWLWCNLPCFCEMRKRTGISYYAFYTEKWADVWGGILHR